MDAPGMPGRRSQDVSCTREGPRVASFLRFRAPPKSWGFPLRVLSCLSPHDPRPLSPLSFASHYSQATCPRRSLRKEDGSKPHPRGTRDEHTQAWGQGLNWGVHVREDLQQPPSEEKGVDMTGRSLPRLSLGKAVGARGRKRVGWVLSPVTWRTRPESGMQQGCRAFRGTRP